MNTSTKTRTARCTCAATSISVTGEPEIYGICHCTNRKRRTGSAFGISTYFRREDVIEIRGETKVYAFHHDAKNHDQQRHFCVACGATLFWYLSALPNLIGVAGGCFADADLGDTRKEIRLGCAAGHVARRSRVICARILKTKLQYLRAL
jgi:hypothetical protein